jgi:glutamine synthetase
MLEEFYQNRQLILKKSQEFFLNSSSLIPKIGCELEFFLFENNSKLPVSLALLNNFIFDLEKELNKKFLLIYKVEKEQGVSQIEIKSNFTSDLLKLCDELQKAKNFIKDFACKKNFSASFAAQPLKQDCGSAMQFNISLHDKNDKNLFDSDEKLLKNIAGALLKLTDAMMVFLAPQEEDYARFCLKTNRDLFKRGKFSAPVNLSFGNDNRTCAIRIPNIYNNFRRISGDKNGKRLEYRVAAANSDFFLVIAAMLLAVSTGIKNEEFSLKTIYGNAFDENYYSKDYQIKNFCSNFKEAKQNFLQEENFIRKSFLKFLRNRHN